MSRSGFPRDPIAIAILLVVGLAALIFAAILSLIFIPLGAAAGYGLYYLYQSYQAEKLRTSIAHVPATFVERTEYLSPDEFGERIGANDLLRMAEEESDLYSCQPLAEAFVSIATSLYAQEFFDRPPIAPKRPIASR